MRAHDLEKPLTDRYDHLPPWKTDTCDRCKNPKTMPRKESKCADCRERTA